MQNVSCISSEGKQRDEEDEEEKKRLKTHIETLKRSRHATHIIAKMFKITISRHTQTHACARTHGEILFGFFSAPHKSCVNIKFIFVNCVSYE